MVRPEAQKAVRGGDIHGERHGDTLLPLLRIEGFREGRKEEGRDPEAAVPILRKAVQPAHRIGFRLQEDPDVGMDRVPPPPFRVPLDRDVS